MYMFDKNGTLPDSSKVLGEMYGKSNTGTWETPEESPAEPKKDEHNFKKLNLNDPIYFEVNTNTLDLLGPDMAKAVTKYMTEHVVDGKKVYLAKMQLWDFISRFGEHIYMGAQPVIKDNNIYIVQE